MNVHELIELLEAVPDKDRLVVLSQDAEGNAYSPLDDVDAKSLYDEDENDIGPESLTPDLIGAGYEEEDLGRGVPAFVMWPE